MTIHEAIKNSIPDAMRSKDQVLLQTLRSLSAAMMNEVIAKKRKPDEYLNDDEALTVLKRAANQRKDSIEQYEKASRPDLAAPETAELLIINKYLPEQMHRDQIKTLALEKMAELGMSAKDDATKTPKGRSSDASHSNEAYRNKLIGALMRDLKGKADGNDVKTVVDNLLSEEK